MEPAVSARRGELAHRVVGVLRGPVGPHGGEHDALEAQLSVLDLGDVLELGRQAGDAAKGRSLLAVELVAVISDVAVEPGIERVLVGKGLGPLVEEFSA